MQYYLIHFKLQPNDLIIEARNNELEDFISFNVGMSTFLCLLFIMIFIDF